MSPEESIYVSRSKKKIPICCKDETASAHLRQKLRRNARAAELTPRQHSHRRPLQSTAEESQCRLLTQLKESGRIQFLHHLCCKDETASAHLRQKLRQNARAAELTPRQHSNRRPLQSASPLHQRALLVRQHSTGFLEKWNCHFCFCKQDLNHQLQRCKHPTSARARTHWPMPLPLATPAPAANSC